MKNTFLEKIENRSYSYNVFVSLLCDLIILYFLGEVAYCAGKILSGI